MKLLFSWSDNCKLEVDFLVSWIAHELHSHTSKQNMTKLDLLQWNKRSRLCSLSIKFQPVQEENINRSELFLLYTNKVSTVMSGWMCPITPPVGLENNWQKKSLNIKLHLLMHYWVRWLLNTLCLMSWTHFGGGSETRKMRERLKMQLHHLQKQSCCDQQTHQVY